MTLNRKIGSPAERLKTGIKEFDRVLGGGFVAGGVILLGGEPGIGKSTLMLQVLVGLPGTKFLYVSGEESEKQLQLRANRLQIRDERIQVTCENNLENILYLLDTLNPAIAVIDSVQTLYSEDYENVPGSVTQVRECAGRILQNAKKSSTVIIFIGHITKEGMIAGPKVLEHLVDTVLYLEGSKNHGFRTLRAMKNRFGATNEIGIFEMQESGLHPVDNPTRIFISERREHVAGSAITVSLEGTRPFLIEVQALVTQATYGNPQRNANGIDYRRLAMLIAVLEKKLGLPLATQDIFVNLVGGLRVDEPAIDLAVVAALVSSYKNLPLAPSAVLIGEVGLVGEVRTTTLLENRIFEAQEFGLRKAYVPVNTGKLSKSLQGIELIKISNIAELFDLAFC
jgi:DNA repair protein RadA/Sms